MRKSDIEILICEDDKSLGPAMAEALKRVSYQTTLVSNGQQAAIKMKSGDFLCYIIDCMLPDQNGVEVAQSVRIACGKTPHIIMTSGIFKEKSFIEQTTQSVEAKCYLTKPFNIENLIKTVDEAFKEQITESTSPLQAFVDQPNHSYSQIIEDNKLHGFKLPLFLVAATAGQFNGFLELQSKEAKVSGKIYFHKGNIFAVESNDFKSLFGNLLVEKGFLSKNKLKRILKKHIQKRIGERLIETNSISPHATDIIMLEQMKIRINKLIQDITYSVSLVDEENLPSDVNIELEALYPIIEKPIKKELNNDWLENHFSEIINYSISTDSLPPQNESINDSIYEKLKNLSETDEISLKELLEKTAEHGKSHSEIYFLILSQQMKLRPLGIKKKNYNLQIEQLKKIIELSKNQTHYERLHITPFATTEDVNNIYLKMVQLFDHKNTPNNVPEELLELSRTWIRCIDESHKILSNTDFRSNYDADLVGCDNNDGPSPYKTKALQLGYIALLAGNYQKAFNIFKRMPNTQEHYDQWAIYFLWAKIKCEEDPDDKFIKKIYRNMLEIPIPYDPKRHAHYHILKGLCHKLKKEYTEAKDCFEHSHSIDSSIPAVLRELRQVKLLIKEQKENTENTSHITTIISALLKRKSG